jgi:hypothetical protein
VDSRQLPCPTCDDVTAFVQPPCLDGHAEDGGECPEWACAECGAALLVGDAGRAASVVWARVAA